VTFLGCLTPLLAFEVLAGVSLSASDAYAGVGALGRGYLLLDAAALGASVICLITTLSIDNDLFTALSALVISWGRASGFCAIGLGLLFLGAPRKSGCASHRGLVGEPHGRSE
jgi:hypothetical protein